MKSQGERITKVGSVALLLLFLLCAVALVMRYKYSNPETVVATVLSVKNICFSGNCFQEVVFGDLGHNKVTVQISEKLSAGERIYLLMQCTPRGTMCKYRYKGREPIGK